MNEAFEQSNKHMCCSTIKVCFYCDTSAALSDLPNARASQAVTEVVKECAEDFLFGRRISVLVETVLEEGVVEAVRPIASEVYYNAAVSRCVDVSQLVLHVQVERCDTLCSVEISQRTNNFVRAVECSVWRSMFWSGTPWQNVLGAAWMWVGAVQTYGVGTVVAVIVVAVVVLVVFVLSLFSSVLVINAACAREHGVA